MASKVVVNREGMTAVRVELGLTTVSSLADRLGIDKGTVSRAIKPGAKPRNGFIAAVLAELPNKFEEIFDVVDDSLANAA